MFKKKATLWILAVSIFLSIFASACSKKQEPASTATPEPTKQVEQSTPTPKPLEPVTLKIMRPGDRPKAMDAVQEEAEKRMKDTINVKLDIVFVPWSDLDNKTRITLSSGENVDLIFDAPWLHLDWAISSGYYEPLEDLIKNYGPDVYKVRPELMWEANKYNGKIMAIPLGAFHALGRSYLIRKDIREKLGFGPIKSYEELVNFMYAVKEKVPGMIPFSTEKHAPDMSETNVRVETDYDLLMRPTHAFTQSLVLYYKGNDGKVYNLFDQMEPKLWEYIKNSRKLYKDKIINQDLMASPSGGELMKSGKVAVIVHNDIKNNYNLRNDLKKNFPDADTEIFTLSSFEKGKKIINFKQWNFIAIPKVSKNKERAMMFLNWTAQKDNYDLLAYGIKGVNWEPVGEDSYKTLNSDYSYSPFAWIWNPVHERITADVTEEEKKRLLFCKDADNFVADILVGFSFDTNPVANEIAQYAALENKYYILILNGIIDPDENWEKFKKEAEQPVKKVQQELQRQIDQFLANKKK